MKNDYDKTKRHHDVEFKLDSDLPKNVLNFPNSFKKVNFT